MCILPLNELLSHAAVFIDAYPNTTMVEQGTTLILVCKVVGVPSTTVLSYQWTCPGGYCDAGAVDPEWAARIQQGNILVVNIRHGSDNGTYTCIVMVDTQQVGNASYTLSVASELYVHLYYAISRMHIVCIYLHVGTCMPVVSNVKYPHCILSRSLYYYQVWRTVRQVVYQNDFNCVLITGSITPN